jgi:hypothetical protein
MCQKGAKVALDQLEADITLCTDIACPRRNLCRRFYSGKKRVWVFTVSPRIGEICDMFLTKEKRT